MSRTTGRAAGGGAHRNTIRQRAYPCTEKGGAIFTYMGAGEPPLFPNYDFLNASPGHLYSSKIFHECNYLQANEGNIDPVHLSYLHRFLEHRDEGYLQEGKESPHVIRSSAENRFPQFLVISEMVPAGGDWKEYTKTLETEARATL